MKTLALCLIEDDEIMGESLCDRFILDGFSVEWCRSITAGRKALTERKFDAVISDVRLPDGDGGDLFLSFKGMISCPYLFITGFGAIDRAVMLLKNGATDYVTKPFDLDRLVEKVRDVTEPINPLPDGTNLAARGMFGPSAVMRQIEERLPRLAQQASALLLTGESGVGKEHVAQQFHELSRKDESSRFVAVNCASIPETLLESELFGYEKGAFTGAAKMKKGLLEQATSGTLFLDEIGEMPLSMQAKLLRAIQEKRISRIGSDNSIAVDFRLVCATHRDLKGMVEKGTFREDLYYRINVINLRIPPIRERSEDILHFLRKFLDDFQEKHGGERRLIDSRTERVLLDYPWPGNLRELRNAVERACIMSSERVLRADAFFDEEIVSLASNPDSPILAVHMAQVEREYLLRALAKNSNHMGRTALELGISRKNLWEKMKKLGMRDEGNYEMKDTQE